jgi:hypothetical protein
MTKLWKDIYSEIPPKIKISPRYLRKNITDCPNHRLKITNTYLMKECAILCENKPILWGKI